MPSAAWSRVTRINISKGIEAQKPAMLENLKKRKEGKGRERKNRKKSKRKEEEEKEELQELGHKDCCSWEWPLKFLVTEAGWLLTSLSPPQGILS